MRALTYRTGISTPGEAHVTQVDPELYALRPWYHDFSPLGVDTAFLGVPLTLEERLQRAREVCGRSADAARRGAAPPRWPGKRARSLREVPHRVPSPHLLNQPVKDRHLMALVARALSALDPRPACLELFSADGYYSCRIKALSPDARVTGVELDPRRSDGPSPSRGGWVRRRDLPPERRPGLPRAIRRGVRPGDVRRRPVPRE